MTRPITTIAKHFVNLLYPLHCASCGTALDAMNKSCLCPICEGRIKNNPEPYCASCGRPMQSDKRLCAECERTGFAFDMARSALLYEGVLKELIHMFKYRGKLSLSAVLCEKIILFLKNHREIIDGADAILFVPLYNAWLNQREYNHSGILASAISREFGVPVSKALEKKRRTSRQSELSREERITNLIGLFRVKEGSGLAGSKVLLVDDVMTTGTTLNECAKTLKSSGVSEVRCLTLARGV